MVMPIMHGFKQLLLAFVLSGAAVAQKIAPPPDRASQVQKIFAPFNHTDSPGWASGRHAAAGKQLPF
ncbi:exported hypothetical protein [Candidatus Sulfopaludibacter sp. SbA4]|nr:exported hypothetical protein [Candidatus Sulfopaludibacter sp. SbA4]